MEYQCYTEATPAGGAEVGPGGVTLLDSLGGVRGVELIVDRWLQRMLRDPLLAPTICACDPAELRSSQTRFFTAALGGGASDWHAPPMVVRLTAEQFTWALRHIRGTLATFRMPAVLIDEVMLALLTSGIGEPA